MVPICPFFHIDEECVSETESQSDAYTDPNGRGEYPNERGGYENDPYTELNQERGDYYTHYRKPTSNGIVSCIRFYTKTNFILF